MAAMGSIVGRPIVRLISALACAGLVAPRVATAQTSDWWSACASERTKFCGNVEAGGGRVVRCLDEHESELSGACRRARNAPGASQVSAAVAPSGPVAARRKAVLDYLAGLPRKTRKKVLSGQHAGDSQPIRNPFCARSGYAKYIDALESSAGKRVAIAGAGYDVLGAARQPLSNLLEVNAVMKAHWNRGGLVTIGAASHNPWTGGPADDKLNGHRLVEAITPGTPAHEAWMSQLDDLAAALADLRDSGVIVLWRPLHEFNGNWFWWGAAPDGQDYAALWRHMHDYFVKTKKLDNLIWVWAGSREAGPWMQPLEKYYPGDAYVDIVGLDIYNDTLDEAAVNAYRGLSRHGKPFALAEYGPDNKTTTKTGSLDLTTLIGQIKAVMPNAVYFMTWSDYVGPAGNMYWSLKSNKKAAELLSDPWVANADDIPGFGRAR